MRANPLSKRRSNQYKSGLGAPKGTGHPHLAGLRHRPGLGVPQAGIIPEIFGKLRSTTGAQLVHLRMVCRDST